MEPDIYTKDGTIDIHDKPAIRNKTGTWRACRYILGNEFCERLTYCGMGANLVNYLETHLNQGNATAARNVTNWSGTYYATPLIGAFLADSYLGRYWTLASFSIIYVLGMILLTMTATVNGLKTSCDVNGVCYPTSNDIALCFIALYLIALGNGGIKPCVSSFGADQFDDADENEKTKKDSYFSWFYFSVNVGALIASSLLVWIQTNYGWGLGFGIPAFAMAIAVGTFFFGTRFYRHHKPGRSPITKICQVIVASFRKYEVQIPDDKSLLFETSIEESLIDGSRKLYHTNGLSFFDKAAVVTEYTNGRESFNRWRLCSVTQVEELKAVIRLLPIWATGIVFAIVLGQITTIFVLQGNTMDPRIGMKFKIPSASISTFFTVAILVWVPIYDYIVVPIARKFTGNRNGFTQLQRMGIGLVMSIFSMLAAGLLEVIRLRIVRKNNYYDLEYTPISILWQIPQYFIFGCAEVFTFIGQLEFFYDQAPDSMRSICSALVYLTASLGNYFSSLLITIITNLSTRDGSLGWIPDNLNRGHVDYFYWLLAVLSAINFLVYIFICKSYTFKKAVETLH